MREAQSRNSFSFSLSHLSGSVRKQKVMVCDLRLVDFDPFCISRFVAFELQSSVACFWKAVSFTFIALSFFLASLYWYMVSLYVPLELPNPEETQIWERVTETNRYVFASIYFCSFCSLLPPLLIWQTQWTLLVTVWFTLQKNPKSWNVFWQRNSPVIRNTCNLNRRRWRECRRLKRRRDSVLTKWWRSSRQMVDIWSC